MRLMSSVKITKNLATLIRPKIHLRMNSWSTYKSNSTFFPSFCTRVSTRARGVPARPRGASRASQRSRAEISKIPRDYVGISNASARTFSYCAAEKPIAYTPSSRDGLMTSRRGDSGRIPTPSHQLGKGGGGAQHVEDPYSLFARIPCSICFTQKKGGWD